MTTVILVEGTWGGDWARARSSFSMLLKAHDCMPMRFQGWSGDVSGVPNFLASKKHSAWIAGGYAFADFIERLDFHDRNVICHSHGLNPVIYACARRGVKLRRVVSVCSPVRRDMEPQARALVKHCEQWRHVHSDGGDWMQFFGEVFDRHWGWTRSWRIRGASNLVNVTIPGIGHSKLLNDPAFLHKWVSEGLIDFLHGEAVARV